MNRHESYPLTLSLVVPVFNEEESISLFIDQVRLVLERISDIKYELVFVNDGSRDGTLATLLEHQAQDACIRVVDLSRNFGKEQALSAGLQMARGDVVIPIDVDLQDPPELIEPMIAKWREGFDVVLARRVDRSSDSWGKRFFANSFYQWHNKITDVSIPENVGDFRLMDRAVVDALNLFPESKRFMKGLFAWVGFRTVEIDYIRAPRSAGESKFNGWKLWNFALEGITSFSTVPLRIWTYIGASVAMLSMVYALNIVLRVIFMGVDTPGYASVFVAVTFLGGVQLIGIGVIGEYLGRTYIETKRRPVYLIRKIYEAKTENGSERRRGS